MDDILERVERDLIIMDVLGGLGLKRNSENLQIYQNILKTKDQAFYYLMRVDELRKAKKSVIWER